MNLTISARAKVFWHVPQVRMSLAVDSLSPVSESAGRERRFLVSQQIPLRFISSKDHFT
jgi:hypothetical protein